MAILPEKKIGIDPENSIYIFFILMAFTYYVNTLLVIFDPFYSFCNNLDPKDM